MIHGLSNKLAENISLSDTLMTILNGIGMSEEKIKPLILSFDIKSISYKNNKNIFKFENMEITFDFGKEINSKIASSYIIIFLNDSLLLDKVEIDFLNHYSEKICSAIYNNNFELLDLKKYFFTTDEQLEDLKRRDILLQSDYEISKNIVEKIEDEMRISRLLLNKKIIKSLKSKLNLLNDNFNDFDYVCNNFLLKAISYNEWKIDNNKNFKISKSNGQLFVETNIFNTGILSNNSNGMAQVCKILFDKNINIISFEFIIRKVRVGNYLIYQFVLDSDFNLSKFSTICRVNKELEINEQNCNGITFDELVSILRFKLSNNDAIYEILPEINVISVYDFNSKDFKDRQLIAEMLLF